VQRVRREVVRSMGWMNSKQPGEAASAARVIVGRGSRGEGGGVRRPVDAGTSATSSRSSPGLDRGGERSGRWSRPFRRPRECAVRARVQIAHAAARGARIVSARPSVGPAQSASAIGTLHRARNFTVAMVRADAIAPAWPIESAITPSDLADEYRPARCCERLLLQLRLGRSRSLLPGSAVSIGCRRSDDAEKREGPGGPGCSPDAPAAPGPRSARPGRAREPAAVRRTTHSRVSSRRSRASIDLPRVSRWAPAVVRSSRVPIGWTVRRCEPAAWLPRVAHRQAASRR